MSIKIPVAGGDLAISPYGIQIIDTNPLPRPAAGDVTYGQEYGQDIDGGRGNLADGDALTRSTRPRPNIR